MSRVDGKYLRLRKAAEGMAKQCGAWEAVCHILEGSECIRDQGLLPECTLRVDEEEAFQIISAERETQIRQCHDLFSRRLGANELEDADTFVRNNLLGVKVLDNKCRYRTFCIQDPETGRIIAAHAGVLVGLRTEGTAVFIGTYAATDPSFGRRGFMPQLLASSLMQAAHDVCVRDQSLLLVVGDCTSGSEVTWNRTGRSRIYIPMGRKAYREVRFEQASLRFDRRTGLPSQGAGAVVEHLMARVFVGAGLSREMISDAVDANYAWCQQQWPQGIFSGTAYRRFEGHFEDLKRRFDTQLKGGNEPLPLFTRLQRTRMIEDGYDFGEEE